jgi:hypothetical protein
MQAFGDVYALLVRLYTSIRRCVYPTCRVVCEHVCFTLRKMGYLSETLYGLYNMLCQRPLCELCDFFCSKPYMVYMIFYVGDPNVGYIIYFVSYFIWFKYNILCRRPFMLYVWHALSKTCYGLYI